jgi:hypothetical protein
LAAARGGEGRFVLVEGHARGLPRRALVLRKFSKPATLSALRPNGDLRQGRALVET